MNNKKIVVLFPGGNYSIDSPLLYYAGFKFQVRGYEKAAINYGNLLDINESLNECIEDIKKCVLTQIEFLDLAMYDDIVFVSKSLGTVVAGWLDEKLSIEARHIYLTPIKESLIYINNKKNIIAVIAGEKDKQLSADILREHCNKENVYLKQIDGVGHRLEVWGDMDKNIEVLREVVDIY